jgi:hypothetical protein
MSNTVIGRNDLGLTIETYNNNGVIDPNFGLTASAVEITVISQLPGIIDVQAALASLAAGGGSAIDTTARTAAATAQSTADGAVSVNTTQTSNISTLNTSVTALFKPIQGANLTNADVTKNPASDAASQYTLPVATLTADHTITLGTTGSPVTGTLVNIIRKDLTAHTYAVINGGVGGGTLLTFASAPATAQAASFYFDGTNWTLIGFMYVASAQ